MSQDYDAGDYNKNGMTVFWLSMAVTLAFFVYVAFVHKGVDLKEIPSDKAPEAAVEATEATE